jgi:hypothetical protein
MESSSRIHRHYKLLIGKHRTGKLSTKHLLGRHSLDSLRVYKIGARRSAVDAAEDAVMVAVVVDMVVAAAVQGKKKQKMRRNTRKSIPRMTAVAAQAVAEVVEAAAAIEEDDQVAAVEVKSYATVVEARGT